MQFNREKFFAGYRAQIGHLTQQQVDGISALLDRIEGDVHLTRVEEPGYMLATTAIETAWTYKPIHEYGSRAYFIRRYGSQTAKGRELGNDTPEEGAIYSGEGDVQLTGESNYEKAEAALRREYPEVIAEFEKRTGRKFDLTVGDQPGDAKDPANAGDPAIAYCIMSYGMRSGMFTGKKLSDYSLTTLKSLTAARRIINGQDRAEEIAELAQKFIKILKASKYGYNVRIDVKTNSDSGSQDDPAASEDAQAGQAPETGSGDATASAETLTADETKAQEDPVQISPVVAEEKQSKVEQLMARWSARWAAIPTAIVSAIGAVWTWLTGAPIHLVMGCIYAGAGVMGVYLTLRGVKEIMQLYADNKTRERDKERAFQMNMAMIEAARNKNMNTVAIVPPVTSVPSGDAPSSIESGG